MSFNLLKDSTETIIIKNVTSNVPDFKLKDIEVQEIKIGIATHPDGSKEYLINMNDMDFVAEFLNGLINKLKNVSEKTGV